MADDVSVPEPASAEGVDRPTPGRITRVILKNYKSIVSCDVELQPLTILVGPNGSGKSNFLDALSFVKDALTVGLNEAIRNRGNVERILSAARAPGDDSFSVELHFQLPSGQRGHYGFAVEHMGDGEHSKRDESLVLSREVPTHSTNLYAEVDDSDPAVISVNGVRRTRQLSDDFLLARHSDVETMHPIYEMLTGMVFYNPLPSAMRDLKRRDPEPQLRPDGSNVASMVRRVETADPITMESLTQYMKRILPGLEAIFTEDLAGRDLLRFSIQTEEGADHLAFDADQLSDGTLRALAVLVALRQSRLGGKSSTSLVGIEEPENNIHPAAARILLAAMQTATYHTQVLATTHSTAMLDTDDIDPASLLAVAVENGVTVIAPIDAVGFSVLKDRLFTAGELLQLNQLQPEVVRADNRPQAASPSPVVAG